MEELAVKIGPDDRLALEELARVDDRNRSAVTIAERALRDGLIAMLAASGLPSPFADLPSTPDPGEAVQPPHSWRRLWARREARVASAVAVAVGAFVALVGGYDYRRGWTGFAGNNQLWDWMHLLLLPIAFGTFPLWLRYGGYMSRRRRLAFAAAVLAFVCFVAAGYAIPLTWTGFQGNTLWDWLTLILLPLAIMTVRMWPSTSREVRAGHVIFSLALAIAWVVTLIGGYADG